MIRRPRGKILQEDYDRVGLVSANSKNGETANIKDIQFVKNLSNLTILSLVAQPISDLRPLANCQKVKDVILNQLKNITSIQEIESLPNLVFLILDSMDNLKRPEQTLAKLTQLKHLRIGYSTRLKDLSFIQNLKNLESLVVGPNNDFSTISKLKTLKALQLECDPLSGKKLPNLDQFNNFQHLEKLEINFYNTKRNISDDYLNKLRAMLPNTEVVVTGG